MDQLRGMYYRRLFRWEPSSYSFDTIGEAETYDFLANPSNDEAFDAAWTLEGPWTDEADDWLSSIEVRTFRSRLNSVATMANYCL